jgi:hypothetical protein
MKKPTIKITVFLVLGSFSFTNCSKVKDQDMNPIPGLNLDAG